MRETARKPEGNRTRERETVGNQNERKSNGRETARNRTRPRVTQRDRTRYYSAPDEVYVIRSRGQQYIPIKLFRDCKVGRREGEEEREKNGRDSGEERRGGEKRRKDESWREEEEEEEKECEEQPICVSLTYSGEVVGLAFLSSFSHTVPLLTHSLFFFSPFFQSYLSLHCSRLILPSCPPSFQLPLYYALPSVQSYLKNTRYETE